MSGKKNIYGKGIEPMAKKMSPHKIMNDLASHADKASRNMDMQEDPADLPDPLEDSDDEIKPKKQKVARDKGLKIPKSLR